MGPWLCHIKLFTGSKTIFSKLEKFNFQIKLSKQIRTSQMGCKSQYSILMGPWLSPIKLSTGRETVFSKLAIFIIHWKIKKSRTVILFSKIDFLIFQ